MRYCLTASLLLCVPLASFYPQLAIAMNLEEAAAPNDAGNKSCCCGTADGSCCGMACCEMPNPNNDEAPRAPSRSDDQGQPVGIVAADSDMLASMAAHRRVASDVIRDTQDGTSLIVLSIRFNV